MMDASTSLDQLSLPDPRVRPRTPPRFCNLERLWEVMERRNITDGLVVHLRPNVYYLSGYSSKSGESVHETNGYGAVILSPHEPDHPIVIVHDFDLGTFEANPTWIPDIRAYVGMATPFGAAIDGAAFDRHVPTAVATTPWGVAARKTYESSLAAACRRALKELGIVKGRVGTDDLRFLGRLEVPDIEPVDAYGALMRVRQVKTAEELTMLRQAAKINETAIQTVVESFSTGMTWLDLQHRYHTTVSALGGFIRDPGGVIVGNPRSGAAIFTGDYGYEDFELRPGTSMMLDFHGTYNKYCWDSGKTWVVDGEPEGDAAVVARACAEAMTIVTAAITPGADLAQLQDIGRQVFKKLLVPDWERAEVLFHGLGLEHGDVEAFSRDGRTYWDVEENQVIATHVVYPGDASIRYYLEDNAVASRAGGASLYSWDYAPLTNS